MCVRPRIRRFLCDEFPQPPELSIAVLTALEVSGAAATVSFNDTVR
jgi:hypothetical protein